MASKALALCAIFTIASSLAAPAEEKWSEINNEELISSDGGKKNVEGGDLSLCSQTGEAMTGFMRDGTCTEQDDDKGSHHICIDLQSTAAAAGKSHHDFCTDTGQPDWCKQEGGCMGDTSKKCPRKGWCVCQWAFTAYVHANGCGAIQDLKCDAVNYAALKAYTCKLKKDPHAQADGAPISGALSCLRQKCPNAVAASTVEAEC